MKLDSVASLAKRIFLCERFVQGRSRSGKYARGETRKKLAKLSLSLSLSLTHSPDSDSFVCSSCSACFVAAIIPSSKVHSMISSGRGKEEGLHCCSLKFLQSTSKQDCCQTPLVRSILKKMLFDLCCLLIAEQNRFSRIM